MPYVLTSNTTKGLEDTIVHIKDIRQEFICISLNPSNNGYKKDKEIENTDCTMNLIKTRNNVAWLPQYCFTNK